LYGGVRLGQQRRKRRASRESQIGLVVIDLMFPFALAKGNVRGLGLDRLDPLASNVPNAERNSLFSEPTLSRAAIDR
jgi:hypothetical protein